MNIDIRDGRWNFNYNIFYEKFIVDFCSRLVT